MLGKRHWKTDRSERDKLKEIEREKVRGTESRKVIKRERERGIKTLLIRFTVKETSGWGQG